VLGGNRNRKCTMSSDNEVCPVVVTVLALLSDSNGCVAETLPGVSEKRQLEVRSHRRIQLAPTNRPKCYPGRLPADCDLFPLLAREPTGQNLDFAFLHWMLPVLTTSSFADFASSAEHAVLPLHTRLY
jgi:hypothetical protein